MAFNDKTFFTTPSPKVSSKSCTHTTTVLGGTAIMTNEGLPAYQRRCTQSQPRK